MQACQMSQIGYGAYANGRRIVASAADRPFIGLAAALRSLWALGGACLVSVSASGAAAAESGTAAARSDSLLSHTGAWRVEATVWETPDAAPQKTTGFVAERHMTGPYLEEIMTAAPGSSQKDFRRIAYLRYFAEQDRWQYVSLDGRFPVGVLPAWSTGPVANGAISLRFVDPGFPGLGDLIERRIVGSDLVLTSDGPDHDISQQYWIDAATGRKWLGVQYDYWRQP